MTRTTRAAAVLAAGATAATLAMGAAPASAALWAHSDPARDVVSVLPSEEVSFVPAPGNRNADITRFVVRHPKKRVIVRLNLRELDRDSGMAWYRLATDKGEYQVQHVLGRHGMPPLYGEPTVTRQAMRVVSPSEDLHISGPEGTVECPEARASVNRRTDRTRIAFPRYCLDRPAWVRAGAAVVRYDVGGEIQRILADAALSTGISPDSESEEDILALSPRVRRG